MTDYLVTDTELTDVADAIRTKGGTSAALEWPTDYVDAIDAISGGGISEYNIVVSDSVNRLCSIAPSWGDEMIQAGSTVYIALKSLPKTSPTVTNDTTSASITVKRVSTSTACYSFTMPASNIHVTIS